LGHISYCVRGYGEAAVKSAQSQAVENGRLA
jgi:hypothetical protein